MKTILLAMAALCAAFYAEAAPSDRAMRRAVAEIRAEIDRSEAVARESQSLEELNDAAREEVIRELKLSARQRREFEPLYKAYREALGRAVREVPDPAVSDEEAQRTALKRRLENIASVAEVKRDYVDRFAEVLTAEQIRRLYNAEGQIGTNIKRAAANAARRCRASCPEADAASRRTGARRATTRPSRPVPSSTSSSAPRPRPSR